MNCTHREGERPREQPLHVRINLRVHWETISGRRSSPNGAKKTARLSIGGPRGHSPSRKNQSPHHEQLASLDQLHLCQNSLRLSALASLRDIFFLFVNRYRNRSTRISTLDGFLWVTLKSRLGESCDIVKPFRVSSMQFRRRRRQRLLARQSYHRAAPTSDATRTTGERSIRKVCRNSHHSAQSG